MKSVGGVLEPIARSLEYKREATITSLIVNIALVVTVIFLLIKLISTLVRAAKNDTDDDDLQKAKRMLTSFYISNISKGINGGSVPSSSFESTMRFVIRLQNVGSLPEYRTISEEQRRRERQETHQRTYDDDRLLMQYEKEGVRILSKQVYERQMAVSQYYELEPTFKSNYKSAFRLMHPFEFITNSFSSAFVSMRSLVMTNAFMKTYEFLTHIGSRLQDLFQECKPQSAPTDPKYRLSMFDVACLPGMFLFRTEIYLRRQYPSVYLDWHGCSFLNEGDDNCLGDVYSLFRENRDRIQNCDVTKESDVKECLKNKRCMLVTGDIGRKNDNDTGRLQEVDQFDLHYGQMIIAVSWCERGGYCFLKMYSLLTENSLFLVDIISLFFEETFLCKPFTSRLINFEMYVMCIRRNGRDAKIIPLIRPEPIRYSSPNETSVLKAQADLANERISVVKLVNKTPIHLINSLLPRLHGFSGFDFDANSKISVKPDLYMFWLMCIDDNPPKWMFNSIHECISFHVESGAIVSSPTKRKGSVILNYTGMCLKLRGSYDDLIPRHLYLTYGLMGVSRGVL
ncbi:hypothetical protein FACS189472_05870 [Alphaproteobacteria bacterium]|nr:hypothetical protein FACS189472_05870 [Alphaproteobacteria bacterium]